ncbi:MAG: DUF1127 domain-containing protein [Gammaproteobacteria bacterium]|nr:DUF1127 domain-containing protein [Gammaproteobacteria bacterium]
MTTYARNCSESLAVGVFESAYRRIQLWVDAQNLKAQVARERNELLEMSGSMLDDMGITWSEASVEAGRQDLPENRLNALDKEVC